MIQLLTPVEATLQPTLTRYWHLLRQMDSVLLDLHKTQYALWERGGQGMPAGLLTYTLFYPNNPLTVRQHLELLATDQHEASLALLLADDPEAIFILAYYHDLVHAAAIYLNLIAVRTAQLGLLDEALAVSQNIDN